jgi:transposase
VPRTLSEARRVLAETPREAFVQSEAHEGYRIAQRRSDYGGVGQRWLVVHSEELEKAARQRLERRLQRRERQLEREYWRLVGAKTFAPTRRMRLRLRKRSPPRIWASITVWDLLHGLWR